MRRFEQIEITMASLLLLLTVENRSNRSVAATATLGDSRFSLRGTFRLLSLLLFIFLFLFAVLLFLTFVLVLFPALVSH